MRWLDDAADPADAGDVARVRAALDRGDDVWTRASLLHVTGSALVVHAPTSRILLRWHERYQLWNHVGGHADDGEDDPYVTALREATEETGLGDLRPFPGPAPSIVLVEIVPVPAARGEGDHEHADVCYVLATDAPEATVEEHGDAELVWLDVAEARRRSNFHVRNLIDRVEPLLGRRTPTARGG
jgi:8-oxo-dGTP pyrophosphatase MutT (NUDIX family)